MIQPLRRARARSGPNRKLELLRVGGPQHPPRRHLASSPRARGTDLDQTRDRQWHQARARTCRERSTRRRGSRRGSESHDSRPTRGTARATRGSVRAPVAQASSHRARARRMDTYQGGPPRRGARCARGSARRAPQRAFGPGRPPVASAPSPRRRGGVVPACAANASCDSPARARQWRSGPCGELPRRGTHELCEQCHLAGDNQCAASRSSRCVPLRAG